MSSKRDWEAVARRNGYHRLRMKMVFESLAEKMFYDLNVMQGCTLHKIKKMIWVPETSVREQIRHYPWYGDCVRHNKREIREIAMARGRPVREIEREQNTIKVCRRCHKKYRGPNKRVCPKCVKERSLTYDTEMITDY